MQTSNLDILNDIILGLATALQIFIVILLYESIKVMEKMYILMIGKLFCNKAKRL